MEAPLVLICGFRRPHCLSRVLEVALKSGLPVVVSLDYPSKLCDRPFWNESVSVLDRFPKIAAKWISPKPLGCGKHIKTAIDRAFSISEEIIVLEDDTIPSSGFFTFCLEMLQEYRDNPNVGLICGSRLVPKKLINGRFMSDFPIIWGWASWRRVWNIYNFEPTVPENVENIKKILPIGFETPMARWLLTDLKRIAEGKLDTWDIQFMWSLLKNNMLSVYPSQNLISNIGLPDSSASNVKTWSHFLFRRRFENESDKSITTFRSLVANKWHAKWMIPQDFHLVYEDSKYPKSIEEKYIYIIFFEKFICKSIDIYIKIANLLFRHGIDIFPGNKRRKKLDSL
jgi:hypothetical protein